MITNIALGMILKDDADILERTAPTYDWAFEHKIVVDTGSSDGGDKVLVDRGWLPRPASGTLNYGTYRNILMNRARDLGHQWLLMLDADEAMWPVDLEELAEAIKTEPAPIIRFPRYNLAGPDFRWFKHGYPDLQGRLINLRAGVMFSGAVHEQAVIGNSFAPGAEAAQHIYHYGYCRDPRRIWLRHQNYKRLELGLPELLAADAKYPDDIDTYIARHSTEPFNRPHPLE